MSGSTYLDLLTQAAGELNLNALGDDLSASPDLAQRLLDRLTWMVDSWNLKPTVVPWYQQQVFSLVPGQQSYLIGTNAPDWNAPRPIRLDPNATNLLLTNPSNLGWPSGAQAGWYPELISVNALPQGAPPYTVNVNAVTVGAYPVTLYVNNGPNPALSPASGLNPVRIPLKVLTVEQWADISLPTLYITFPQAVYLDRSVVAGTNPVTGLPYFASRIAVWGVPAVVNQIELFYWQALMVGNLNDPVNAPPGYFRALFLNLAVEIAAGFGITPNGLTLKNAADALGDIKELNAPDMRMRPDPGMPSTPSSKFITKAQFLSGVF
jgi:hypothetical protein